MIVRFIILILVTWAIVHKLYYKKSHRRDFYFSFMLMSVAIFFLVYFMIFELEDLKTKTSPTFTSTLSEEVLPSPSGIR